MSDLYGPGSGPVDHVYRLALPWRDEDGQLTECGRDAAGLPMISREQLKTRIAQAGKTRTAMTVCITCWQTAHRWDTWDKEPLDGVERELHSKRRDRLRIELRAVEMLIAAHPDEFADLIVGLNATPRLDERRRRRREIPIWGSS